MVNANVIRFRSLFSCLTNGLIIRRSVVTCSVSVGAEQPLHRDRSNRLRLINYIFYFFIFRPQVYIHPEGLTMCGIWALFGVDVHSISKYDKTFSKIQHRGPDAWRLEYDLKVKVSNAWRWYTNESKIASQPHGGIGIFVFDFQICFAEHLSRFSSPGDYRQPLWNATDETVQISTRFYDLQWRNFQLDASK